MQRRLERRRLRLQLGAIAAELLGAVERLVGRSHQVAHMPALVPGTRLATPMLSREYLAEMPSA